MTISERSVGDVTILDVSGRIAIQDGADVFGNRMRDLIRRGRVRLIVNFRDVPYIDSTALGQIIRAYTSATRKEGSLKLLQVTPKVHQLLVITKLLSVFDLFDEESEALRSFGSAHGTELGS